VGNQIERKTAQAIESPATFRASIALLTVRTPRRRLTDVAEPVFAETVFAVINCSSCMNLLICSRRLSDSSRLSMALQTSAIITSLRFVLDWPPG